MKNAEQWRPTKFVLTPSGLSASRDPRQVGVGSRFIADILARHYHLAIQAHAAGSLLDLGCGHVPLYEVYRELVEENICADWENTIHTNPYLDFTVDLNQPLPFDDQRFNTVLLTDVLEHIAEPMNLMNEVARVLRPGGKLILGVPFFYWLHEVPHDYYRYTEFALRRFCDRSGLKVLELMPYGGLPETLFDLTSKAIDMLPRAVAAGLRPLHTFATLSCRTKPVMKISEWTRAKVPLGYLLVAERS